MKTLKLYLLILMLVGFSNQSAQAHRLDATETSVSFNQRSQHIEVIHKFYLHDVNHLIQQHFAANPDADKADKNQAFVEYILTSVKLNIHSIDEPLSYIGSEEDGKFFYIYQEVSVNNVEEVGFVEVDTKKMENSWKPTHWLFSIDIHPNASKSFVLKKAEYEHKEML